MPGECHNSSSPVHNHGIYRNSSSKQTQETKPISMVRIYEPKEKNFVIGIVLVRTPDLFLVDINSTEPAVLPTTSFDNGRLPPRHAMNRFSVVCAHVVRADPWTQTELSCQSRDPTKKNGLGLIERGNLIRCSLVLSEKLQRSKLIHHLRHIVKDFCIRNAQNGFVWYTADATNSMIAIKNVLYRHEFENDIDDLIKLYHTFMNKLQQQDDSLVEIRRQQQQQQEIVTKPMEITKTDNIVARMLHQTIKDILDKMIDKIENNEKT